MSAVNQILFCCVVVNEATMTSFLYYSRDDTVRFNSPNQRRGKSYLQRVISSLSLMILPSKKRSSIILESRRENLHVDVCL